MLNHSSTIPGRQRECGRDEDLVIGQLQRPATIAAAVRVMGLVQRKAVKTQPIQREIALVYALMVCSAVRSQLNDAARSCPFRMIVA